MKPWERDLLEYRPKIGYQRDITAVIVKKPGDVFTPSKIAQRSLQVLGVDAVDNLMAAMSKANDILQSVDKCLSHDPTYQAYREAKDSGDLLQAHKVYADNLKNINGKPQLDVIPLVEETKDEMEAYLDFVNQELFDGQVDYNDTDAARKAEEDSIDTILRLESEGKPIDYNKLNSRIKTIAAVAEKANVFMNTIDNSDTYLKNKAKDYLYQDVEGYLQYAAKLPEEKLPLLGEALQVQFRKSADTALTERENMFRVGDRAFREILDQKMSATRQKVKDVYDPMLPEYMDDAQDAVGAEVFKSVAFNGLDRIRETYDYMVSENIANSKLNSEQTDAYFKTLDEKKKAQSLYQLTNKVSEDFDRSNPDKEIPRFIKTNKLMTPGTYCG